MRLAVPRSRFVLGAAATLAVVALSGIVLGGYALLRASSAFAVQAVPVDGGNRELQREVQRAARSAIGEVSLLAVDRRGVEVGIAQLPQVREAEVDRAFPASLRIRIVPERPVARIVIDGRTLLVAETGRVIGDAGEAAGSLPQISAAPVDVPGVGGHIGSRSVTEQIRLAAAPIRPLRIVGIGQGEGGLTAKTRDGYEIRFGDAHDLDRKIATTKVVLRRSGGQTIRYLDVSVPATPVVQAVDDDPRTAYAVPPVPSALPPIQDVATWIEDISPQESIRTLFG